MIVDLPAPPTLGAVYARALSVAARRAMPGGAAPTALPQVTYRVEGVRPDPARLSAYQHLVGEAGTDELPPGFVHVLAFPLATALMARPDFPLALPGLVHVTNTVTQHRALRLGEGLVLTAHAQALRPHRSGTQVDLVTTAQAAPSDEVAWRGVSTYLAKGVRLAGRAPDEGPREPFVAPLPTGQWSLDADAGRRYAAVSGDVNPIHLSALSARAFGFRRAIAHGMFTAARALADVGARRGSSYTWSVAFAAPVLLPARVQVRVADDEDGWGFVGWSGTDRLHLTGRVDPG